MSHGDLHPVRIQTPAVSPGRSRRQRLDRPSRSAKRLKPSSELLEERSLLAVTIDNGLAPNAVGFFSITVDNGGESRSAVITANGTTGIQVGEDALFAFVNYVDVGGDGGAISLSSTTVTQQATLQSPGVVVS